MTEQIVRFTDVGRDNFIVEGLPQNTNLERLAKYVKDRTGINGFPVHKAEVVNGSLHRNPNLKKRALFFYGRSRISHSRVFKILKEVYGS